MGVGGKLTKGMNDDDTRFKTNEHASEVGFLPERVGVFPKRHRKNSSRSFRVD